jgi:hypothetical protein
MLRRWLNSVLALALSLTPAAAQDFGLPTDTNVFPQIFRAACTVNDAATTSPVTQTDVVIPGVSDGDSVVIYVGVIVEDAAATFSISSLTVDGAGATEVVDEDGSLAVNTGFYRIGPVTNAGTVSITVSYSEAITSSGVCVWAAKNLLSAVPTSSVADDETAGGNAVLTTGTTVLGGYVLAVCVGTATAQAFTWGVLTEQQDTQSGEMDYTTADGLATGASMSNTCESDGTEDNSGSAIAIR